jgi:hypothetical protein
MGEAALKVWLAGIVTRYGSSNIRLNWTEALRGDERLAMTLEGTIGRARTNGLPPPS